MACCPDRSFNLSTRSRARILCRQLGFVFALFALFVVATWTAPRVSAQNAGPHVTGVDPASGKVNDTVTVSGENLGKDSVAGVFLSDDKNDYKATITDQSAEKIVMKVPQVKAGDYNVSIQVADKILILPVKFMVSQ